MIRGQRSSRCAQGGFETRVAECVAGLGEHGRGDPLAGEQHVLDELAAVQHLRPEARNQRQVRPVQDAREHVGELGVGHRLRGREVDWADDPGGEEVLDRPDLVVDADPALPLTARAESSAEAELEPWQLPGQRPASGAEDDSGAQVSDGDARRGRRLRGPLPGSAQVGQETRSGRRRLVEYLVAAGSVDADRRATQQHARRTVEGGERAGQQAGALRPALDELGLARRRPAFVADARSGEMDHRVDTLQLRRGEFASDRIPANLAGPCLTSHQAAHVVTSSRQSADEC